MTINNLNRFIGEWLPRVEAQMLAALHNGENAVAQHYGMMRYHMGWANEHFAEERAPSGKRLRPMFCLLACAAVGGNPALAVPAASALELLHNFSLIHDDIEDHDEMRRHRPTVWKVWGVPQAINAGDGMFAIAFDAIQRLYDDGVQPETTLAALRLFTSACIELTEGQHIDVAFESRAQVTVDEYMRMIRGKTAALLGACTGIGAIIGGAEAAQSEAMWSFGINLGIAFQIQDDILGIWGDPAQTGKVAGNDILRQKKSLPLLHALAHAEAGDDLRALMAGADFATNFTDDSLPRALRLLERSGSRAFAEEQVRIYHERSAASLREALPDETLEESALQTLADSLMNRTR